MNNTSYTIGVAISWTNEGRGPFHFLPYFTNVVKVLFGYDGPEMRRDVYLITVAFWTSAPLFAVLLALSSWPPRNLGWLAEVVWGVVVASSAFLTLRSVALVPRDGDERSETRQTSESLVYLITFLLTAGLVGFQLLSF